MTPVDWITRRAPRKSGFLEVGITPDHREVIINHPDLQPDINGCGHIIFSPAEARALAALLIEKASDCDAAHIP